MIIYGYGRPRLRECPDKLAKNLPEYHSTVRHEAKADLHQCYSNSSGTRKLIEQMR